MQRPPRLLQFYLVRILAPTPTRLLAAMILVAAGVRPSSAQLPTGGAGTVGFTLGAGIGTTTFGGVTRHDLALIMYERTWSLTRGPDLEVERRARWQVGLEVTGGAQVFPRNRDFTAISPMVRYRWRPTEGWVTYAEAGIGASYTNIRGPDLSTRFEFINQFGGGALRTITKGAMLNAGVRWIHVSNGGIASPNNGVNALMLRLGAVWKVEAPPRP